MSRVLDPPDPAAWRRRGEWFWKAHDVNAGPAALTLDARAENLVAELELAFCAGAWATTVLVAWALVEGVERVRGAGGSDTPPSPEIDGLRARRNALAHGGEPPDDETLESWAQGAVRTTFHALHVAAWR